MKRKVFFGLAFLLAFLLFSSEIGLAFDSYTQRLSLTKPMMGSSRWGDKLNSALDLIDTAYGNILNYASGRPELYAASATLNGSVGVDVTLPKPVDAVNDYAVSVIYTSSSGANKGSLAITKATSKVTVFSSNASDANPIEVLIYYASTVTGYGAQVHRQWYVFPGSGDQTRANTVNGITALMIANGRNKADFILPGNASYNIMDPPLFLNAATVTFNASAKTISCPAAAFVSSGFAAGMPIEVYGSAYNDFEFTIASVTETTITVNETIVNESSTAALKVRWIIPSWIRLLPQNGALFNRADGKNLHIRGPFDPGDFQVFTGTGTTTFGPGAINHVPVTWCGAVGDGYVDNTAQIKDCAKIAQQTITGGYDGATLMFPSGIYNVTTLKGCWGSGSIRIGGAGKSNTLVKSTTKQTVFDLSDLTTLRYLEMYDMTIEGGAVSTDAAGSGHGVHIDVPGGNYAYSVEIRQVKFRGFTGHAIYAPDAFNIQLHHLDVDRCKDDAIYLRGGNTNFLNNVYVHGVADGKYAFRLISGYFVLMSCLGIDSVWDNPANGKASWGHFGDAVSGLYARGQIIGCDVEDFSDKGLYFESGSWAEIKSTNIYGARDKTGLVGIYYTQIDDANLPTIDAGTRFRHKGNAPAITFTGSGQNNLLNTDSIFVGPTSSAFRVQVDSAGATDTFKWSADGGSTWKATGVAITGTAQQLENGVVIEFSTTTGHVLDDYWDFTAVPVWSHGEPIHAKGAPLIFGNNMDGDPWKVPLSTYYDIDFGAVKELPRLSGIQTSNDTHALHINGLSIGELWNVAWRWEAGTPLPPGLNKTPRFSGELYVDTNTTPYTVWTACGLTASDWRVISDTFRSGSGTPESTVTPRYIGEEYLWTGSTPKKWFKAVGTTSADWVALN